MAARDKRKRHHIAKVGGLGRWQHKRLGAPAEWHCRGPGGAARQAAALRREGVMVDTGPLGELTVDLVAFGWFPSTLPSEEAEASESEGRED